MIEIDIGPLLITLGNFANMVVADFSVSDPLIAMHTFMFKYQGWLLYILIVLVYGVYPEYMMYIQSRWAAKNAQTVLLAIDVPKLNEQSVQAMENFFDHLLGAHTASFLVWEKYFLGAFQLSFSLELISIEGNIQFLIRTPKTFRNLVEAAIYGQFSDAEITEVQDYVTSVPRYYPNATHDMFGVEMTTSAKNVYLPIKTYEKFEHRFSETFVDPMAALLENMAQIGPGEQIWIQYLIRPLAVDWGLKGGLKEINKIIGKVEKPKPGLIDTGFEMSMGVLRGFADQLITSPSTEKPKDDKKEDQFRMMNLTPGQKEQLESIERKISKLAFNTKIRFIYVFEKHISNKALAANGTIGAFKQWTDMNANGLKPDMGGTGTSSAYYVWIERRRNTRKNNIMGAYRRRDGVAGTRAKPLNTEELASIWHFPGLSVKAPFVKATSFKKMAAPVSLPQESKLPQPVEPKQVEEVISEKNVTVPTFDYDNDEFEKQFALDREAFAKSRPARAKRLTEIEQEEKAKAEAAALQAEEEVSAAAETEVPEQKSEREAISAQVRKPKSQAGANFLEADIQPAPTRPAPIRRQVQPDFDDEDSGPKKTPGNLPFLD